MNKFLTRFFSLLLAGLFASQSSIPPTVHADAPSLRTASLRTIAGPFESEALAASVRTAVERFRYPRGAAEDSRLLAGFQKALSSRQFRFGVGGAALLSAVASHLFPEFAHWAHLPNTVLQLAVAVIGPRSPIDHRHWNLGLDAQPNRLHNGRFYDQLVEDVGSFNSDWARMGVTAEAILELETISKKFDAFSIAQIRDAVLTKLKNRGVPVVSSYIDTLIQKLINAEVVAREGDLYKISEEPEAIAVKFRMVHYIAEDLRQAMRRNDLKAVLTQYGEISERWPLEPVESRWPLMQAVATLSAPEQNLIIELIRSTEGQEDDLRMYPAIDGIWLMLGMAPGENWIDKHAPYLKGKTIYTVASEGWYPAGGLGRVQQYHSSAMAILAQGAARVVLVEPYYPVDYGDVDNPATWKPEGFHEVDGFDVPLVRSDGKQDNPRARVFAYKREVGPGIFVDVFMIQDTGGERGKTFYTNKRYDYDSDKSGNFHDFSDFIARATLQLIDREERKRFDQHDVAGSEPYEFPVVIGNDGQLGRLPRLVREDPIFKASLFLKNMVVAFVTHTYGNRGRKIEGWEDPTSRGLAFADLKFTVAAVHRFEVSKSDPNEKEIAVTNGDTREATRTFFAALWRRLFPHDDIEHPKAAQMRVAKETAKREFRLDDKRLLAKLGLYDPANPDSFNPSILDPNKVVITETVRAVTEKAGRARAFTYKNLERLAKAGAQVVLYVNAQPQTQPMVDEMIAEARKINVQGFSGKIIVRSGWSLDQQREALAFSDVMVFDSHRGTEAAGLTEANGLATGTLIVAPDFAEGILNLAAPLLDRSRPGFGGTLVPSVVGAETGPEGDVVRQEGYWEVFRWVIDTFDHHRDDFCLYQANVVPFSRALEAVASTGPEYLRQLSAGVESRQEPLAAVRQYVNGEREAGKHFAKPWAREQLVASLERAARHGLATPLLTDNGAVKAYAVHLNGEEPFVVAVDASREWWRNPADKKGVNVPFKGNEAAFDLLLPHRKNAKSMSFMVFNSASRTLYAREHRFPDDQLWNLGVPYPGVQVLALVPVVSPEKMISSGVRVQSFGKIRLKIGKLRAAIEGVPEIPALKEILEKDPAVHNALAYLLQRRPPRRAGGGRDIFQVPVRWLGGWGTEFISRLVLLLEMMHVPRGSFVHLIGAQPEGTIGRMINDPNQPHVDAAPGYTGEFYQAPLVGWAGTANEIRGRITIKESMQGAPGRTSSMYSIASLAENVAQLREATDALHGLGDKAMVDFTGHLSSDSHVIAEHFEFFKTAGRRAFPNGIPSELGAMDVVRRAGEGFLVELPYSADLETRLKNRLGLAWGVRTDEHGNQWLRFLLQHHQGIGPMTDTAALDFDHQDAAGRFDVQEWYIAQGKKLIDEAGVDAFRFDLSERIKDDVLARVKKELFEEGKQRGRVITFMHEDYRGLEEKIKAGALNDAAIPNLYYNNPFAELFRTRFFDWKSFPRLIQNLAPWLSRGHFVNFVSNHDQATVLGQLYGERRRPAALALQTFVFCAAGSSMVPWWDVFGWVWFRTDVPEPEDIARELTGEEFARRAAAQKERTQPLREFIDLIEATDHEALRDGQEMIALSTKNESISAIARPYKTKKYGNELAIAVINFSPDSQTGSVEIPLERLGRRSAHADAADDLFMLRDRLSKKVYFKTRKQLGHLFENLNPFERRIYFIRQIHNPGATLRNLVNNVDMQGGFRAEAEYRAPTFQARHEPHPSSLPWSAPSAHALPTAA